MSTPHEQKERANDLLEGILEQLTRIADSLELMHKEGQEVFTQVPLKVIIEEMPIERSVTMEK